ncbi:hypothetical protein [Thermoclostridium caenicola]|uniref:PilX N-terminal n=1 Tax=Thermoclostridium caenicola TaxID=659425 RepID=A0A1M6HSV1_9FIRM|nr:hypothetical protein [Thermoclostridium caenicola]SHJ25260.1 hypothetical protein SAMN05444373_10359 [Thermoclostridium caenicola]
MKWLTSNRGSSSILVALVLIILVVFGVLAVATSSANLRLAMKHAETVKTYYNLDSEGERFLNGVYNSVQQGREKASAALRAITEGDFSGAGLPANIAEMIRATLGSLSGSGARQRYMEELYPKLVMYYAMSAITEAYPGCVASMAGDYLENAHLYSTVPVDLHFIAGKTFILEHEGSLRYLNVRIEVSDPDKEKNLEDICAVLEWRMWQEPFEYRNELDLWEGRPE